MAISRTELLECERSSLLEGRKAELVLEKDEDAEKIDSAIEKFQKVLKLNPNTFTRKQEAIFSLALKEALYEVLDVPDHHRDLDKEMLRIKRHDFW